MVLLRGPTNYSRAKYMDSIQSYKNSQKTSSLQRLGADVNGRGLEAKSSPHVTIFLFKFYRRILNPLLHAFGFCGCRFVPSCSHYAEHLFKEEWSVKNFFLVAGRIFRCNGWTTPVLTFDPPTNDYLLKNKI